VALTLALAMAGDAGADAPTRRTVGFALLIGGLIVGAGGVAILGWESGHRSDFALDTAGKTLAATGVCAGVVGLLLEVSVGGVKRRRYSYRMHAP
jgi:hypothetical protein